MASRTSLAAIVLWQLSTADELQRLADWSLEECGKYKTFGSFVSSSWSLGVPYHHGSLRFE